MCVLMNPQAAALQSTKAKSHTQHEQSQWTHARARTPQEEEVRIRRMMMMMTSGVTRASGVCCNRQTTRRVVTRATANTKEHKVESRRAFARNAALVAAAAVLSVAKVPAPALAEEAEIPEKLKKKICANNATAKLCVK
mmetsp:Transcript_9366/g.33576  ORF Transcript_9366/g.33576 Transcript_9366/m.33576 type:complete len:139 (+) Transcript_9366:6-422(+)